MEPEIRITQRDLKRAIEAMVTRWKESGEANDDGSGWKSSGYSEDCAKFLWDRLEAYQEG